MGKDKPRISIGMPVFNGENYIVEALDSIIAQTYSDFELIISDNASTDGTEEICRAYADKDQRIYYFRNEKNLGAARNFNRIFELSSGEYFKWAAHDDVIAPDFLLRCVEVLERDPSVVLCYSKIRLIDERGEVLSDYKVQMDNVGSLNPQDRFRDLTLISHWGIEIFGLIRVSALKDTPLIASYPGSDRTLMAGLSLLGQFHQVPEYLFFSRDHSQRSIRQGAIQLRARWFDTSKSNEIVLPHWRMFLEHFRCVRRTQLNRYERTLCYLRLVHSLIANLNWARMLMDLVMVVEPRTWDALASLKRRYYGIKG